MTKHTFDIECDSSTIATIASEVIQERFSQTIKHGYTKSHEDEHRDGELAMVAALYASPVDNLLMVETDNEQVITKDPWPFWTGSLGTPHSDRHRDKRATLTKRERLVIAGAMILAEIERLDRAPDIPAMERANIQRILSIVGDAPFGATIMQRQLGIGYNNAARSIERGMKEGALVAHHPGRMLAKKKPDK